MIVPLNEGERPGTAGFALPVSLFTLALLVSMAILLAAFVRIELVSTDSYLAAAQARLNAVAAARMALGELQLYAGQDRMATVSMDNGWVAAVDARQFAVANGATLHPLVSGSYFLDKSNKEPFGQTTVAPECPTMLGKLSPVAVPWIGDGESGRGRFAFGIFDESQKIDVTTYETRESVSLPDIQGRRQLCAQRHDLDLVAGIGRADQQLWRETLGQAATWKWLEQLWRTDEEENEEFSLNWRLHTNCSLGVLGNAAEGGLRINWDQRIPSCLSENQLPCSSSAWEGFFQNNGVVSQKASAGLPIKPSTSELALRSFPILTGLRVRFGFFNTRTDGYHRTRFHVEAQFWNPTPSPMLTVDGARLGLLDMEVMPKLDVINHNTGGSISVDMSSFPVGQFGLAKQTASDTTANAWMELLDGRRFGMASPGLLAGEVYNFFMPNPVGQPQGLSRVLSATTWKMQSDPNKPTKPPSGAKENNWFHATHRIELKATMPKSGVTLHIREARGTMPGGSSAAAYSASVLTLKNVPFRDISLILTGEQYNRKDSTSYQVNEARIGFSLKLKGDNPKRLEEVLKSLDLREPVLDFSDSRVAALYQVEQDVLEGLTKGLTSSEEDGFLWDAEANDHRGTGIPFSEMRCLEGHCLTPPLSVASLRHLPRAGFPTGSLLANYPSGREVDTIWFDRAFFAGAWPELSSSGFSGKLPWFRNPWLVLRSGCPDDSALRDDAASCCMMRSAFNVNCEQFDAWRVVLGRVLPGWQRTAVEQQSSSSSQELKNCFFRLPFGAAEPRVVEDGKCDLPDEKLIGAGAAVLKYCGGAQGFRALGDAMRDSLATELCFAIRRRHEQKGPFLSLSEFAESGVLAEALKKSGCNAPAVLGEAIPAVSPLKLNPGDILESLLPLATVRGDTFKVRVKGASLSHLGKLQSVANAEVIIQRLPEFCDDSQSAMTSMKDLNPGNRHLGRRFHIISWRWLDSDEWQ
ncbi:MAG: hypothetical protein LBV12_03840 [Puniceicoccales bacterium]|jgi:hypothetical protein|nr:hypothetical protein [Puniceicoccales bacterium]